MNWLLWLTKLVQCKQWFCTFLDVIFFKNETFDENTAGSKEWLNGKSERYQPLKKKLQL